MQDGLASKLTNIVVTFHDIYSDAHTAGAEAAKSAKRKVTIRLGAVEERKWDLACSCGGCSTHNIMCPHMFAAAAKLASAHDVHISAFLKPWCTYKALWKQIGGLAMPELTWQSIVDELRSLRIDNGLDPTLRLTVLKAGASGRPKGLTKLYTASQKRMHFNRASALQLLLQGLEQFTGIRVSQAVPVKEVEVLEDQEVCH